MEKDSPHPWFSKRWFLVIIYQELVKDWPEADEEVLWAMGSKVGKKKWTSGMNPDDKKRFFQCEEIDKKNELEKKATPKRGKKEKQIDDNKPKHAMTSFFIFMKMKRDQAMAANPDFTTTDI